MRRLGLWFILFGFIACNSNESKLPKGLVFPEPPQDNLPTPSKIELGRRLFYENALSVDSSISCSSCHLQKFAFSDTARVSVGVHADTGFRNSRTLANLIFQNSFFADGGVNSIERAVHPPVLTEFEMGITTSELIDRLKKNNTYKTLFNQAFQSDVDYAGVVKSLAAFQRTLLSFQSPYDEYMKGDKKAISESVKRGLALFQSDSTQCATCHIPPLFIDNEMHNVGLAETYKDYGRGRVSLDSTDFGKFRTPTLRNIAVTAPYMHNGQFKTLDEVLDFYAKGGEHHPNKSSDIVKFNMSDQDKEDLIQFLNALTDNDFLSNAAFSNLD